MMFLVIVAIIIAVIFNIGSPLLMLALFLIISFIYWSMFVKSKTPRDDDNDWKI